MIEYTKLKEKPREFLAATGIRNEEFECLLPTFEKCYQNENTGKVVYLSPTVEGKKHAKKLADEAEISYPPNASLTEDTGFQGYEPDGVVCEQPKKEARTGIDKNG